MPPSETRTDAKAILGVPGEHPARVGSLSIPRTGIFLSKLASDLRDVSAQEIEQRYAPCFLVVLGISEASPEDAPTVRDGPGERHTSAIVRQLADGGPLVAPAGLGELVVFPVCRRPTSLHDVVEVGRLDVNDIVLHHPSIAGFHAALHRGTHGHFDPILDRRTSRGTLVDGERVASDGEGVRLSSGRQLRLGNVSLVYLDVQGLLDLVASLQRSLDGTAAS